MTDEIRFRENEIYSLGPGLFIREAVDNSVWADLGDGAVVIDGLEDRALAPVIAAAVEETTGKPIKWVVNTHWHADHKACNPIWAREQGATVIAHESCAPRTDARDGNPDITFSSTYTLEGNARVVELKWMGGTHTPWDTVVYFPWARVLHISDLFGWGLFPLREVNDETIARTHQVTERVLEYDAITLIPGHGPVFTPAHLRRWLQYFDETIEKVTELQRTDHTLEEIKSAVPPPADMQGWWRFVAWKHESNIDLILRCL